MEQLSREHHVTPIFSDAAYSVDSRFGTAREHIVMAETICGTPPLHTLAQVEPVGPKKLFDILIIAPCTGNTLAKLAHSIADTPVTMAAKSHLRNGRPVLVAVSSNDALAGAAGWSPLLSFFVPQAARLRVSMAVSTREMIFFIV